MKPATKAKAALNMTWASLKASGASGLRQCPQLTPTPTKPEAKGKLRFHIGRKLEKPLSFFYEIQRASFPPEEMQTLMLASKKENA